MEYNKSLSARIRRRNTQGFKGIGNYHGIGPYPHPYGDYTDQKQNNKEADYKRELARKNKLGVGGKRVFGYGHILSKKFADNSQKMGK